MASHILSVCIFCFICATHSHCGLHYAVNDDLSHINSNNQVETIAKDSQKSLSMKNSQVPPRVKLKSKLKRSAETRSEKEESYEIVQNIDVSKFRNHNMKKRNSININKSDDNLNKSSELYLNKIFNKFGDGGTMTMEGFQKFIERLDLLQILSAKLDDMKNPHKVPNTSAEWLKVARNFEEIEYAKLPWSSFYNSKGQNSIVLLPLVDANYKFLYFNVGINGRILDGGVYKECELSKAIAKNSLKFPEDRSLPMRTKKIPFVIAAGAAFPLTTHIMKPYPFRKMTNEQRIFNYRLSRARCVVENAFGILANRFRCLFNVSVLRPKKVKNITQACCALHNYLSYEMKAQYTGADPAEEIDKQYTFVYNLSVQAGNRPKTEAIQTRQEFKDYFNGVGSVPWQEDMVYRL